MKVKDIKAIEKFISTMNEYRKASGYFETKDNEVALMNDYVIIVLNNITDDDKIQISNNIEKSVGITDIDRLIKDFVKLEYLDETKEIVNVADLEIVKQIKRENKLGRDLCTSTVILKYPDLVYKNNNTWLNKELLMIVGNCLGDKQIEIITTGDKLSPAKIIGKYGIAYIMPLYHD